MPWKKGSKPWNTGLKDAYHVLWEINSTNEQIYHKILQFYNQHIVKTNHEEL
jgi:hypothetical protein